MTTLNNSNGNNNVLLFTQWFHRITGLEEDVLRTTIDNHQQQQLQQPLNKKNNNNIIFVPSTPDPEFVSWEELGIPQTYNLVSNTNNNKTSSSDTCTSSAWMDGAAATSPIITPSDSFLPVFLDIINQENGSIWGAGAFFCPTIGDMIDVIESRCEQQTEISNTDNNNDINTNEPKMIKIIKNCNDNNKQVLFELIVRNPGDSPRYVDVAYQQARIENNKDSVFQAASNFNAVESTSEKISPDEPFFTTNYIHDMTQGPAASISAGAAAIARVHAAFYNPNNSNEPKQWQQTASRQINLLESVSEYIPVTNGYALLKKGLPEFPPIGSVQYEQVLRKTKIAYHRHVQVTSSEISSNELGYVAVEQNQNQRIDQVFVAALNVGQGFAGHTNWQRDNKEKKIRQKFVLQSAYDGTYLAAIVNRRKNLYLTLIGGGVFGNDSNLIWKAIIHAHRKYGQHPQSTLQRVSILLYSPYDDYDNVHVQLTAANIPWQYVRYDPVTGVKEILSRSSDSSEL